MIRLKAETDFFADEPNEVFGLVTRSRVEIRREAGGDGSEVVGTVSAAVIHYGEAANVGASLCAAMGEVYEPLYEAFFHEGGLRDVFDAIGDGLLYIEAIEIPDSWRERSIDLAVVRRLSETLGMGCSMVVLNPAELRRRSQWGRVGFSIVHTFGPETYLAQNRGQRAPRVVEVEADRFEVIDPREVDAEPAIEPADEPPAERAN